jgi:hypothetical protein
MNHSASAQAVNIAKESWGRRNKEEAMRHGCVEVENETSLKSLL